LGKPTGAAMPLVWAHAEYVRLVRSLADGAVFDRIAPVADRYLTRKGRRDLEVWKPRRQVRSIARGHTLRVEAPAEFRVLWTHDGWKTRTETSATDSGLGIHYVDIAVDHAQRAPIHFTIYWLANVTLRAFERTANTWEGRDYVVDVR